MRCTHYLVIILLLIAQTSFGQIYQNMAQPGYKFSRARFDSVLTIPTGLGNLKNITGGQDTGQIRFNKSDSSIYVWNGRAYIKPIGGGVSDTLKVSVSDTAAMLANYAKSAALALKVNISDTAAMLSPYVRTAALTIPTLTQILEAAPGSDEAGANQIKDLSAGTSTNDAATFGQLTDTANLRLRISDTATMLSNYAKTAAVALKLNIADTATMLAPYSRVTVSSYGKNAGRDSTILLLSNGTRYAAKDSVGGGGASGWSLTGNAGTDTITNYLGTSDRVPLLFRVNNVRSGFISDSTVNNTGWGFSALRTAVLLRNSPTEVGEFNSAFGTYALQNNTTGRYNTAMGSLVLKFNTTGRDNVAIGSLAMQNNTSGIGNTAVGTGSQLTNTVSSNNTSVGNASLNKNTANSNTAIGTESMSKNTSGGDNTALGFQSLVENLTGANNVALGRTAMPLNTSGSRNIGIGVRSLNSNQSGADNIAIGFETANNNTASNNVAIGRQSLYFNASGGNNTALGYQAGTYIANGATGNTTAINSIFLGYNTKANAISQTNQIVIGYDAVGLGSNTTTIGNSSTVTTALYGSLSMGTIGTPAASSIADFASTTKGVLFPRMTTTQKNAIATPAAGLVVYDTTLNKLCVYTTAWETITSL